MAVARAFTLKKKKEKKRSFNHISGCSGALMPHPTTTKKKEIHKKQMYVHNLSIVMSKGVAPRPVPVPLIVLFIAFPSCVYREV